MMLNSILTSHADVTAWADLPIQLQHASALRSAQQDKQLRSHQQPSFDIPAARHTCRSIRDGIDASRMRIKVVHVVQPGENQVQLLPMAVDPARFRGLRRLDNRFCTDMGTRSSVHVRDPPAWLQVLHIHGFLDCTLL